MDISNPVGASHFEKCSGRVRSDTSPAHTSSPLHSSCSTTYSPPRESPPTRWTSRIPSAPATLKNALAASDRIRRPPIHLHRSIRHVVQHTRPLANLPRHDGHLESRRRQPL